MDKRRRRLSQLDRFGNTLNLSHPAVVDYASACLRYWDKPATSMVSALSGGSHGPYARVPSGCAVYRYPELPALPQVKLIAEPWDIAPGGYRWEISRRCLPSGTIISAMLPIIFWLHYHLPLGGVCRAFCCLQRCF
ncbi:hypothetical protein ACNKHX_21025 [Shigella flexneri]